MNIGIYQKQGSKWPQMFVGGLKNALVQLNQDDLPRRSLEVKEFFEEAAIAASEDENPWVRVILTFLFDAIISFMNIIRLLTGTVNIDKALRLGCGLNLCTVATWT